MKKLYDYEEIINYLNTGKQMDQSIQKLASDIKELTEKVKQCEESFHGYGNKSICKAYKALYSAIGKSSMFEAGGHRENIGCGMWRYVSFAVGVCNTCYTNAELQKQNDEGAQAMQSFSGF